MFYQTKPEKYTKLYNVQNTIKIYREYQQTQKKKMLTQYGMTVKSVQGTDIIYRSIEELEQVMRQCHAEERNKQGRGGNNAAENIKKSVISLFRKMMSKQAYSYFEEKLMKKYGLKSQKQNFVLFIMFLNVLQRENLIEYCEVKKILCEIRKKIQRYIDNSRNRALKDSGREQFHLKNICQFEKYLKLDLEKVLVSNFEDVCENFRPFYLRKKVNFDNATLKIRRIVQQNEVLSDLYFSEKKQLLTPQTEGGSRKEQ